MRACVYNGEEKRTNIDDIFAFSLASYCCNSSHQCYSNSNNYRTGKAKTQIYICDVVIILPIASQNTMRTRQEESSCIAFLKAVVLFIIRHTHTNGSVNQCVIYVCGENKSRSSALYLSTPRGISNK